MIFKYLTKLKVNQNLLLNPGMAKTCKKCVETCGVGKLEPSVLKELNEAFEKLSTSDSKSLLKKYLTADVFKSIVNKKTSFGSTLLDCIQSGVANLDSSVGLYAPDTEAYNVFAELFNPVIEEYHLNFTKDDSQPPVNFGNTNCMADLDPKGTFIVSTRVRCGRSLAKYPLNPCMTEEHYIKLEEEVKCALGNLTGELGGDYLPLKGMSKITQKKLIDDHFLFAEGDRFLQAAKASRFWPTGRGIFLNDAKTFVVWVNEEDHMRIISLQKGGDLGQVYKRFVKGVEELGSQLTFARDERLGYLTFCPTNIGTGIRASVHIKVPKLAADESVLHAVAKKYNLQVRGTGGEHTSAQDGVYDISNKRRLGLSEYDVVREMQDGIMEIIKEEKSKSD
ncbi:unnamed protein product [Brassicogethes aeneus]|uniref:arginine kinase n=1 Tax=Brassicogethes aeneus TaxID=1431903 RepID=A0A9P0AND0_BRAAE|nr:unnamed protein product [Brassicogethes aeneus]